MSLGLIPLGNRPLGLAPDAGGATNTAINPGAGTLSITGYVPTIAQSANQSVAPGVGGLAITGYAPTVSQSSASGISPGVGTLTLTGYAPSIAQTANQSVSPAAGTLVITGYAPTITQASASNSVTPDVGVLTITGYAPTIEQSGGQGMPMFFGGGAGNMREVRAFADLLSKAPTKTAKKRRIRELKEAALDLLPDDPEAVEAAQAIAQVVAKKEVQTFAQWRPVAALQPVVAKEVFDPAEEIRQMVEEWLQNEAIEDEFDVELLLLD
jgi:hypothetical protein